VPFHVLGHIKTDDSRFVVEQKIGQGAGKLGFPHPGRPQKEKRADGAAGGGDTGPVSADGIGNSLDRVFLADNSLVQVGLHSGQLFRLRFHHAGHRDAGPIRHDLGNILFRDNVLNPFTISLPLAAGCLEFFLHLEDLHLQPG
jgi:hypothetical protein